MSRIVVQPGKPARHPLDGGRQPPHATASPSMMQDRTSVILGELIPVGNSENLGVACRDGPRASPVSPMIVRPMTSIGTSTATLGTAWQIFAASHYGIGRFEVSAPTILPDHPGNWLALREHGFPEAAGRSEEYFD